MGRQAMAVGAGALLLAGALLGCGSEDSASDVAGFDEATTEYTGPLHVDRGSYGAAGEALDCAPAAGQISRAAVYGEGATSDDLAQALDTAVSEGLFLFAPTDEVRLAKAERDRALLTYEADGRILMALVFRDGPATEGAGGRGWYLEAAARCDFADFPEAFAEKAGYQIWRDQDGDAVPVTRVHTAAGPEHCDWQSVVFLSIGERDTFIRDPDGKLQEVTGPFRADVDLPSGAVDTGYERNGRRLWLATDNSYAYVGTSSQVEAWPRFDGGCA